jgi:ankyrin repeat protein
MEMVRLLISEGADKEKTTSNGATPLLMTGFTPLLIACQEGHLEVVQLLVSEGADKEKATSDGCTPLLIACWMGHMEVAQLLISEGADKEKADSEGCTPLYIACQEGHMEVVQLLISEGADKEKAASDGKTPLYIACQQCHTAFITALRPPERGGAHMEVVQLLISKGADKDKAKSNGFTPLLMACQEGHLDMVQLLVSEGADKEKAMMSNGCTPLYFACLRGHMEVVRLLISEGADKEKAASNGATPLLIACQKGHMEVVKFVLAACARDRRSSSIADKRTWIEQMIRHMQRAEAARTGAEAIPLALAVPQSGALEGLCHVLSAHDFSAGIDVQFEGNPAVGDGVRRQYLNLMAEEFSNPDHVLLESRASDGDHAHRMQPSESSGKVNPDHLAYFEMLGKLIGVALMQAGGCLCIRFTIPFLKQLLGLPIDIPDDLEKVDPALYATKVVQLRQYDESTLGACDLTFEEEEHQFHFAPGVQPEAVRVSSGVVSTTMVTAANRENYIQAVCRHHLIRKIRQQTAAVRQGLLSVVPAVLLEALQECLSAEELGILIAGFQDLDLDDWQQHTQYEDGYTAESPQIKWFWSIINENRSEGGSSSGTSGGIGSSTGQAVSTLAKLTLRFATGSESVGAGGFELLRGYGGAMHKFTIKRSGDPEALPTAATCFNTLRLPAYLTREALEAKLGTAVREGKGGFNEGAVAQ